MGIKFHLYTENKLIVYKAVMKPIWSYGIELWGLRQQRSQPKILRATANAPRYVTNHSLHTYFSIPYVIDIIHERINKNHIKLEDRPNPLLEPLLQSVHNKTLKRYWPFDLQGT
jgi:hypothetical protein